ncbi:phosphate propanoyltransferase [Mesobacillus selenatarsenatis]|uniref:Phosphate propanoyltransferase n=1 Tax=Mesobacillus selenatarsenatis TaxID=388741 RepID=A0A846TL12_9BACI|nr:phosphate propanoyltransferase [Mesobacillus selenatarsenatis]NKE04745.1 phosphate propanoyltransferase [Mesobacillus selenatarsenatis]
MMNINHQELLSEITRTVVEELKKHNLLDEPTRKEFVPVSVSARHVHLQQEHVNQLFGEGYTLTKLKEISQPGQFACNEQVTIEGPKGKIEKVRILGPLRSQTQVEIARTDARKLGLNPPVRNSGNLADSSPISIIGPKGKVVLQEGCIIADRHIHMTPTDAVQFGVRDKQKVSVLVDGEKAGIMGQVMIRVRENYALDMHIDTDDANAFGLAGNELLKIIP